MTRDIVLYHADCADGFAAAWCAHTVLGPEAEYIPVPAGSDINPFPERFHGKSVYLLDWCLPAERLEELAKIAHKVVALDHHPAAEQAILAALNGTTSNFDGNKSGAMLAWEYFGNSACPDFIRYVQDHDMGKHELANTKTVNAYIQAVDKTLEEYTKLSKLSPKQMLNLGEGCLMAQKAMVRQAISVAVDRVVCLGKDDTATVQVINIGPGVVSEALREVGAYYDYAIGWHADRYIVRFSLRSSEEGSNVRLIAEHYGGGGHDHAAWFSVPLRDIRKAFPELAQAMGLV